MSLDCISFQVRQEQNCAAEARKVANLPKGRCSITITNSENGKIVYGQPRRIKTIGKTVSDFLIAPDTSSTGKDRSKWIVIQEEMVNHAIKEITITVCPEMETPNYSNS